MISGLKNFINQISNSDGNIVEYKKSNQYCPYEKFKNNIITIPEFEKSLLNFIDSLQFWKDKLKKKDANDLLCQKLSSLNLDEEIWLPFNEFINIAIKKTSLNYFEITVINTGKTTYHPAVLLCGETLVHSVLIKRDVPSDTVLNKVFLTLLINNIQDKPTDKILYENILPALGGTAATRTPFYDKLGCDDPLIKGCFAILRHKMRQSEHSYKTGKLKFNQNSIKCSIKENSKQSDYEIKKQAKRLLKLSDDSDDLSFNENLIDELIDIAPSSKSPKLENKEDIPSSFSKTKIIANTKNFFSSSSNLTLATEAKNKPNKFDLETFYKEVPKLSDARWDIKDDNKIEEEIIFLSKKIRYLQSNRSSYSSPIAMFLIQAIITKLCRNHSQIGPYISDKSLYSKKQLAAWAFNNTTQLISPSEQDLINELLRASELSKFDPSRDNFDALDANAIFSMAQNFLKDRFITPLFKDPIHTFCSQVDPTFTLKDTIDLLTSRTHCFFNDRGDYNQTTDPRTILTTIFHASYFSSTNRNIFEKKFKRSLKDQLRKYQVSLATKTFLQKASGHP